MANTMNIRGTKNPSFQIGRSGPTLRFGDNIPNPSLGVDGDIFIVQNANSEMYIKRAGNWDIVSSSSNSQIGNIAPGLGVFIVGDGSDFVGQSGNTARTSLGLGTGNSPIFLGLTTNNILRNGPGNVNLFTNIGAGNTLTIGQTSSNVQIRGNLEILGNTTQINVTELVVADNNITINNGGTLSTSLGAGLNIEVDSSIQGFIRVSESDQSLLEFKAPTGQTITWDVQSNSTFEIAGNLTLDNNLLVTEDVTLDQDLSTTSDVNFASLVIGSPSGGNQGAGSLNVETLFVDGQAVVPSNFVDVLDDLNDVTITNPSLNQLISWNGSQFVNVDSIGWNQVYYVSSNGQDATGRGSVDRPFATIQYAIDNTSGSRVIRLNPGEYNENLVFGSDATNILIEGWGTMASHPVIINGHAVYQDAALTRVRLRDLRLRGITNGIPTLTVDGTQGRHFFDNVVIDHTGGSGETALEFVNSYSNWMEFNHSTLSGICVMGGTPASNATLTVIAGNHPNCNFIMNNANWSLVLERNRFVRKIEHTAGRVTIKQLAAVSNGSGGSFIDSTAASGQGFIEIFDSNLLRPNGTYALINKTGNCDWYISQTNRDVSNDILNGTRIAFGDFVNDVSANRTANNYLAADDSLLTHLNGIDAALGNLLTVTDLFDLSGAVSGDVLYFNGVDFVSEAPGATSGVQAFSTKLDDISAIAPANGTIIVGDGTNFIGESGNTARTSLGLGDADDVVHGSLTIVGGSYVLTNGSQHQSMELLMKNVTTNNTITELFLDGISDQLIVPENTTWLYEITVIARRTDVNGQQTGYRLIGIVDREIGPASIVLVGDQEISFSQNLVPWTVLVDADSSTGALRVSVQGENGKTIRWTAFVKIVQTQN
jgi:hypothetical protein